jgi:NAD(P)-dependent dehydrogenase (short-subunit alcohol dehydrogenase family)
VSSDLFDLDDDLFDLTGKVAIVTGGSRGLGLEMSRAFARSGASVVVASRKVEACEAVAAEIRDATEAEAVGLACHVGRWEDCDRLVEQVHQRFGRADVLVNNAGMSPLYPSLPEVTEQLWDKVFDVNLKGAFRLSTLFAEQMSAQGGGSIINVSSIAAVQPGSNELPYAAAKAALNTLTIGFARAYAPHVRVNCIMPGMFLTDISEAWTPGAVESAGQIVPLGRAGDADEIVGTALYLASDASSYTTGAVIKVDGGLAFPPA